MTAGKAADVLGPGTVLITGGTKGIGGAIARRFHAGGWRVAANYRSDQESADALVEELGEQRCRVFRCDVTDRSAVGDMFRRTDAVYGPLSVLVNNAGVWYGGPIGSVSDEDFRVVLETTLLGSRNCMIEASHQMRELGGGHIVNIGSAVATVGWRGDSAYAAAKAGLVGMSRSLAKEFAGDGINVNVVAPGFVDTAMTASTPERERQRLLNRTLLPGPGRASQVAEMVFAVATAGTFMTGSVVAVDGGLSLGNDRASDRDAAIQSHN